MYGNARDNKTDAERQAGNWQGIYNLSVDLLQRSSMTEEPSRFWFRCEEDREAFVEAFRPFARILRKGPTP